MLINLERYDPSKNRTVKLEALTHPDDNLLCPPKLLLILALALRLGRVEGKPIDEVLSDTRARPNKTVVWVNGDAPVLCAFTSGGGFLILDQPA